MFKELGAMMSLLENQGKIQEEMQKFQAQVGDHHRRGDRRRRLRHGEGERQVRGVCRARSPRRR